MRSLLCLVSVVVSAVLIVACGDDPEPAAEGPVPPGETVSLAGLDLTVPIARQLNPRTVPDRQLVGGRLPDGDQLYFGVFLRACNDGDDERTARPEITLTTSPFDRSYAPVELGASNPFAWEGGPVAADGCLPREGSVDDEFIEGSLVLFEVPRRAFANRPLVLRLSQDGETRQLELDL